ncbi:hypothetical protein ILYODFUR_010974 [Ilyodon furcidens]|uniref:Uncharacterized protein n=1 Tax=Ilyodon furcidens TaxID=33524 RepID=A0ABV0VFS3_9TELE
MDIDDCKQRRSFTVTEIWCFRGYFNLFGLKKRKKQEKHNKVHSPVDLKNSGLRMGYSFCDLFSKDSSRCLFKSEWRNEVRIVKHIWSVQSGASANPLLSYRGGWRMC